MEIVGKKVRGVIYAGIDVGYGLVKSSICKPGGVNKETLVMPSTVATGKNRKMTEWSEGEIKLNLAGKSLASQQLDCMYIEIREGDKEKVNQYFLGRLALQEGKDTHYCWEVDKSNDNDAKALLLSQLALQQLIYSNGENSSTSVRLATGLPVGQFLANRDKYVKNYNGQYTVTFLAGPFEGKYVHLNIIDNKPLPQAFGLYYDSLHDDNLQPINNSYLSGHTLVIDVGHRTTDYSLFYEGKMVEPLGSFDSGMSDILKAIVQKLKDKNVEVEEKDIDTCFLYRDGWITTTEGDVDLKVFRTSAVKKLANRLNNEIPNRIGPDLAKVHKVLVGGGGGEQLYKYLTLDKMVLVDNPKGGNASGFLKNILKRLDK